MKKFFIALILLLSFLVTPVFANACDAEDSPVHKTADYKNSHDTDSKIKTCQECCHQHNQEGRFVHKEALLKLDGVKSSFPISYRTLPPSIVIDPLLKPPAA